MNTDGKSSSVDKEYGAPIKDFDRKEKTSTKISASETKHKSKNSRHQMKNDSFFDEDMAAADARRLRQISHKKFSFSNESKALRLNGGEKAT